MRAKFEESKENHVELLEAREDSAESFETTEQALDLVALFVVCTLLMPGVDTIGLGRKQRNRAQVEHQLSGSIAFVRSIHKHRQAFGHSREFPQQLPPLGCIVGIS
jgi:hypothetical protein